MPFVDITTTSAPLFLIGAIANSNNRTLSGIGAWDDLGTASIGCATGPPFPAAMHGAHLWTTVPGTYEYSGTLSSGDNWVAVIVAYRAR